MTVRRENSYKKRAKDIPYKCRECGREHTRLCDLSLHLSKHHSMSLEDYYIENISHFSQNKEHVILLTRE